MKKIIYILFAVAICIIYSEIYVKHIHSKTYFEANDLANHIFKNGKKSNLAYKLTYDDSMSWVRACVIPTGQSIEKYLDRSKEVSGNLVDEQFLDYLTKIVLFDINGNAQIQNFDARLYNIQSEFECANIDKILIDINESDEPKVEIHLKKMR